jgi:hypothetical protein
MSFLTKDVDEQVNVTFDFTDFADSIASAAVSIATLEGTDTTPGDMLDGAVTISGAYAIQRLIGGVDGVKYRLRCEGTLADGQVFVAADTVRVITY